MPQFSPQGEPDTSPTFFLDHLGYRIVHKTDFGRNGYWDDVRRRFVASGFIVIREGYEALPAGIWFETVDAALHAIRVFVDVHEDPKTFLTCMHACDQDVHMDGAVGALVTALRRCEYVIGNGASDGNRKIALEVIEQALNDPSVQAAIALRRSRGLQAGRGYCHVAS